MGNLIGNFEALEIVKAIKAEFFLINERNNALKEIETHKKNPSKKMLFLYHCLNASQIS